MSGIEKNYKPSIANHKEFIGGSNSIQAIYSLEFEICIFSREQNKKSLINISNLVVRLLSKETLKIPRYTAAGLKLNDLFFDEARDLIHNKLTMRYKAMIKKELM